MLASHGSQLVFNGRVLEKPAAHITADVKMDDSLLNVEDFCWYIAEKLFILLCHLILFIAFLFDHGSHALTYMLALILSPLKHAISDLLKRVFLLLAGHFLGMKSRFYLLVLSYAEYLSNFIASLVASNLHVADIPPTDLEARAAEICWVVAASPIPVELDNFVCYKNDLEPAVLSSNLASLSIAGQEAPPSAPVLIGGFAPVVKDPKEEFKGWVEPPSTQPEPTKRVRVDTITNPNSKLKKPTSTISKLNSKPNRSKVESHYKRQLKSAMKRKEKAAKKAAQDAEDENMDYTAQNTAAGYRIHMAKRAPTRFSDDLTITPIISNPQPINSGPATISPSVSSSGPVTSNQVATVKPSVPATPPPPPPTAVSDSPAVRNGVVAFSMVSAPQPSGLAPAVAPATITPPVVTRATPSSAAAAVAAKNGPIPFVMNSTVPAATAPPVVTSATPSLAPVAAKNGPISFVMSSMPPAAPAQQQSSATPSTVAPVNNNPSAPTSNSTPAVDAAPDPMDSDEGPAPERECVALKRHSSNMLRISGIRARNRVNPGMQIKKTGLGERVAARGISQRKQKRLTNTNNFRNGKFGSLLEHLSMSQVSSPPLMTFEPARYNNSIFDTDGDWNMTGTKDVRRPMQPRIISLDTEMVDCDSESDCDSGYGSGDDSGMDWMMD